MQRQRRWRLIAAALLGSMILLPAGAPAARADEGAIDPRAIALRVGDLPAGFALAPDTVRYDRELARRGAQVVLEMTREDTPEHRADGPLSVKQIIVRFDDPVSTTDLLPQFRDALGGQGFSPAPGHDPLPDMTCLMKPEGDLVSYEVGQAKADTLTFTVVRGQPGTVTLQTALDLSAITAARYDAQAAALGRVPTPLPDLTLRRSRLFGLHEQQMYAEDGHEMNEDEKEAALDRLMPKPTVRAGGLPTRPTVAVVDPPPPLRGQTPGTVTRFENLDTLVGQTIASVDTFWSNLLGRYGIPYRSPRTAWLPKGHTVSSECGTVEGPAYCPAERTLYLTEAFFKELWPTHDFAAVVVIGHEWGHYVQHRVGILGLDVPRDFLELQADCFAGLYANHALREGWLEQGDIPEALALTRISGDAGHGAGEERVEWFMRGFSFGEVDMCFPWSP